MKNRPSIDRQPDSEDRWLHPCDLCGSLEYEFLPVDPTNRLFRCHVCGLVQAPDADERRTDQPVALPSPPLHPLVRKVIRTIDGTGPYRLLLIGDSHDGTAAMLDRPEITIVEHPDAISSLGGETESFDIIICTRRLESIGPASTLFARSRTLLRPLGLFLVGGSNWNALERRWRPKAWLAGHAEATQYGSLGHLRSYATRFGFEIVNAGTTPRLEEISAALYGGDHPAARLAATPFGLAGALPGLGSIFWGLLAKRGLAPSRVTHAEATDEALAPGLATLQIYHRENPPFDNRKSSFETD